MDKQRIIGLLYCPISNSSIVVGNSADTTLREESFDRHSGVGDSLHHQLQ